MRVPLIAALAAVLPVSFPVLAVPPPRYFPLDPGNTWRYSLEGWPVPRSAVIRVLSVEGDFVRVDLNGTQVRLAGPPDELDLELPVEGLVPYYRFSQESWIHRDLFDCNDGVKVVAASRAEVVETPAGRFEGCLKLDYQTGCDDAGRASEWWKPEVGLVKWSDVWDGGLLNWVLESFERERPPFTFLRGDGDGDGEVAISDAVFALEWLFRGGPGPACEDALDANDDGRTDLSDPVYLLGFLFLGSSPLPHPGPSIAAFDGTPDDPFTCGDPPAPGCKSSHSSSLPGVSFDLSGIPCVLTLSQVTRGFSFNYRTVIEDDLPTVTSWRLDDGTCDPPDASGLVALEMIRGGYQFYCLCDSGLCRLGSHRADLRAGTWDTVFEWDGRNWRGPSDVMAPKGPPFPPGTYVFSVAASGEYIAGDGAAKRFDIYASTEFHLVP